MTLGLVIGKFYPPHLGHKLVIDTASADSDEVVVLVCTQPDETIPGELRAQWLRRIHPTADVRVLGYNDLADDDSAGWARYTISVLGRAPDVVFTSEDYGDPYARFMGCAHHLVDKPRQRIPVSARYVRRDPQAFRSYLHPVVGAYYVPRVYVVGAESTGTTTLAAELAEHLNVPYVPEYGRDYAVAKHSLGEAWESYEFWHIADTQSRSEDTAAEAIPPLVVCDTDAFATGLWSERYVGSCSPRLEAYIQWRRQCVYQSLYLLTGDEIPFVQDGTRDGEHIRHAMQQQFRDRLAALGRPFNELHGPPARRLDLARRLVEARFDAESALHHLAV